MYHDMWKLLEEAGKISDNMKDHFFLLKYLRGFPKEKRDFNKKEIRLGPHEWESWKEAIFEAKVCFIRQHFVKNHGTTVEYATWLLREFDSNWE